MKPIAVVMLRKDPPYRREAFVAGLMRLGYEVLDRRSREPTGPVDLLVMWNKKRSAEEHVADQWERAGGTVIVCENGYLQKVDKTRYAISTHGHGGSGWFPYDRGEDRFSALGFEIKPWQHNPEGHWLVCGQRGVGSALMASPQLWGEQMTKKLQVAGLNARLRQHPGNFVAKVPLLDDMHGAAGVVVWSSSSGVLAVVEGYHTAYFAPRFILGDAATYGPQVNFKQWTVQPEYNRVVRPDRLNRMAHGQHSVEEIASGEPFARMRDLNWGPRWH